jgi:CBS domain-containing protein
MTDFVVCPNCGFQNMHGADTCENCLSDLRTLDVPGTSQIVPDSVFLEPLTALRLVPPRTLDVSATVREAVDLLREDADAAVVLLHEGRIAGIFTERDVLKRLAGDPGRLDRPVAEFMTPDPVILRETDTIAIGLNKMGDGGFRHIPLVRDTHLVGVATAGEFAAWLMSKYFD